VLPETGQAAAGLVARRICESFANDGRIPKLSVSIGIAVYPKDGDKLDSLLGAADAALYSMKAMAPRWNAISEMKSGKRHCKVAAASSGR